MRSVYFSEYNDVVKKKCLVMEFSYYVTLSQSTLRDIIPIRPLEFLKSTSPETVSDDS